ncbi:MAG TPA: hypothetical protein ENI05_06845 [Porticoccus sp.]|nr:hypothetical protein [Porticoccus sp.]
MTLDRLDGCLAAQEIHEITSKQYEMFVCYRVPLESWYASKKMGLMPAWDAGETTMEKLELQKLRLEIEQLRQETGR